MENHEVTYQIYQTVGLKCVAIRRFLRRSRTSTA